MNRLVVILLFFFGSISIAFSQSYVVFSKQPQMQLQPQNQYNHCKINYKAAEKSTIYLELKRGEVIVASGVYDVPNASEQTVQIPLKTDYIEKLVPGSNYSYNLYMYAGGRNDWTKKACRSAHINKVQMQKGPLPKKGKMASFKNFFN